MVFFVFIKNSQYSPSGFVKENAIFAEKIFVLENIYGFTPVKKISNLDQEEGKASQLLLKIFFKERGGTLETHKIS